MIVLLAESMNVGLFIPCYINQFYPRVAIAALEVLEKQKIDVTCPPGPACCGQPLANAGFSHLGEGCHEQFLKHFSTFDYVVCPSGSCALHLKEHVLAVEQGLPMRERIFELTEFLTDVVGVNALSARFPFRVGIHQSCHGLRGLRLAQMTELVSPAFSKPEKLLNMVEGLRLVALTRKDECCGFGGTFSVEEEAVSVRMGQDRIEDFASQEVDVITGVDMSCLMHLDGILRRQRIKIETLHIAEILNAG